jgi:hypothetical protein
VHGEFVVFTSFLDRGLAFPTSQFLRQLLAFYGIKIPDLGSHSLQQISFFITLCEGYLECPVYFPLWLTIFHGQAARVSEQDGGQLLDSGGIMFQVQGGEGFISVALPSKAAINWRKQWFYMGEETTAGQVALPTYSPLPSNPRRLWVRQLPVQQVTVEQRMREQIRKLKKNGLGQHLPPLGARSHLMCEYTGENDSTWSTATTWDVEEYKKVVGRITSAPFHGFNKPLLPYDAVESPAPLVSPLGHLAPLQIVGRLALMTWTFDL